MSVFIANRSHGFARAARSAIQLEEILQLENCAPDEWLEPDLIGKVKPTFPDQARA
jgi:hypothetical protein